MDSPGTPRPRDPLLGPQGHQQRELGVQGPWTPRRLSPWLRGQPGPGSRAVAPVRTAQAWRGALSGVASGTVGRTREASTQTPILRSPAAPRFCKRELEHRRHLVSLRVLIPRACSVLNNHHVKTTPRGVAGQPGCWEAGPSISPGFASHRPRHMLCTPLGRSQKR